jgi:uncharacterized protein (TIGR00369 family)
VIKIKQGCGRLNLIRGFPLPPRILMCRMGLFLISVYTLRAGVFILKFADREGPLFHNSPGCTTNNCPEVMPMNERPKVIPMNERSGLKLPHLTQMMLNGSIPQPPIAELIGFKLVSIGSGQAVIELEAGEKHANPMGTLHGGVLCDISDAAMGMAYASTLSDGETFTTLELKINFLKPVRRARLRAEGSVVRAGRTVGLVMCDVFDENRRLVARASSTCMTLRGEQAVGR